MHEQKTTRAVSALGRARAETTLAESPRPAGPRARRSRASAAEQRRLASAVIGGAVEHFGSTCRGISNNSSNSGSQSWDSRLNNIVRDAFARVGKVAARAGQFSTQEAVHGAGGEFARFGAFRAGRGPRSAAIATWWRRNTGLATDRLALQLEFIDALLLQLAGNVRRFAGPARRSALCTGSPLARSHSTVVSR